MKPLPSSRVLVRLSRDHLLESILSRIVSHPAESPYPHRMRVYRAPSLSFAHLDLCQEDKYCGNTYAGSSARISFDWDPNNYFNISLSNQLTGAYVDGISPSNNFSGTIKIYPLGDKKLFTSLNGQFIYNALTSPQVNNSFSLQLGTKLF